MARDVHRFQVWHHAASRNPNVAGAIPPELANAALGSARGSALFRRRSGPDGVATLEPSGASPLHPQDLPLCGHVGRSGRAPIPGGSLA